MKVSFDFPVPYTLIEKEFPAVSSGVLILSSMIEVSRPIVITGARSLVIQGVGKAGFSKSKDFLGTEIIKFVDAQGVHLDGLEFQGWTPDPLKMNWGDDGLFFPAGQDITIQNCRFLNFGDAAIRVAGTLTKLAEDIRISDNYFENITQITTTNNNGGGGAKNYYFTRNKVMDLKGSIAVKSRQGGTGPIWVQDNFISGVPSITTSHGVEIVSSSHVSVTGNYFEKQGGAGVTVYQNNRADAFQFGYANVQNNTFTDGNIGIRFAAGTPGLVRSNNTFINVLRPEV
jgi:polygalacturonase